MSNSTRRAGGDGDEPVPTFTRVSRSGPGSGEESGRPSARPLYLQVKDHLIRRVLTGEWRPGECLPSEIKLAEGYGLSQGTVRKAIEEMAVEGLVTRHPGRGTFVTSHKGDYQPFRFHRFYADSGKRLVAGNEIDYISCRKGVVSPRAAKALQLDAKAAVAEIVRLRRLESRPALVEYIVLGADLCPDAERLLAEQKPDSIYLILEQSYNLLMVRVDERLRARAATADDAQLLELAVGTPVLEVERVAYSLGGEPVEWRLSVCQTDDLHYWNRIG